MVYKVSDRIELISVYYILHTQKTAIKYPELWLWGGVLRGCAVWLPCTLNNDLWPKTIQAYGG